ncbi:hypothetical protein GQ53DRAFT_234 [Thozetella sp. PMI_491]|nr:hypothetical protein GQ53DRAFT_234 [Thozetella sp. PMI_491]
MEVELPGHTDEATRSRQSQRRVANVYDAVAGRVSAGDPLWASRAKGPGHGERGHRADKHTSRDTRLPPERALFSRKHAPSGFIKNDRYFANHTLPDNGRSVLPESDTLKTIHSYVSNFYEALALRQEPSPAANARLIDERSMDETALLAFGIILEEASLHTLGRRGDLVFTEEEPDHSGTNTGPTEPKHGSDESASRATKRRKL